MKQQIQIRIGNLSSSVWRDDLQAEVLQKDLNTAVELLDVPGRRSGSTAAVDPQVMAAMITGGALMPRQ